MSEHFDYEKMKKQILEDSALNEIQKTKLLEDLAKKIIPPDTKVLDIKISNEIPQKTQDALELAEKMRETLKLKYLEFGLDCPKLENLEDMDKASAILKALKERNEPRESPSGSAPLEGQYNSMKGSGFQEGFETHSEMVDALRFQEKFGESDEIKKNAAEILNQLYRKWITAKRENPNFVDKIPHQETPIEYRKRTRKKRER